jgi:hypothetical protein
VNDLASHGVFKLKLGGFGAGDRAVAWHREDLPEPHRVWHHLDLGRQLLHARANFAMENRLHAALH